MSIISRRKEREIKNRGAISFDVTGADVGKTIDFMGILAGFRVTNVNVTVDAAFANANNTISVGLEEDVVRFVPTTAVDAIKGIGFNNRQFEASNATPIVIDILGTASATGEATVTVEYLKLADSRQEY